MIGSFLTRGLVMVFGYAYPAYECFKTVEMNKPDIEQLRFWCQYWILVAMLTVSERIFDAFVSWVPMYSEAKLAFFIYLWWPKTKGTTYVYDSFFRPLVAEHENEIDRNLLELRTKAGDMAVLYWQRAISYGQTRIFDVLQYIASQSNPPQPTKKQEQGVRVRQPTAPPHPKRAAAPVTTVEEPTSPMSSTSSSQDQDGISGEVTSQGHVTPASLALLSTHKATPPPPLAETSRASTATDPKVMEIDSVPSGTDENAHPVAQEQIIEETVRVTRARARKSHSAPIR